jgi:transposase-like protein
MRKSDVICPECGAGYRRIELATRSGKQGEFRCLICDHLLEYLDGSSEIAFRLTVQPAKYWNDRKNGFQADEWRPVTRERKLNL